MSPTTKRRRPHPVLTGAALVCLLSLPGVLVSIFLTVVKFRSAYRCDFSWFSACTGEFAECGRVLASDLSMFGPLPISAFSTAIFTVMFGLAIATLRSPSKMTPETRPLLLALATMSLLAVIVLGGFATFVIGGYCSYCVVIYACAATLFLSVALMHPQGLASGYRVLFSRHTLRSSALVISLLSLLALLAVQHWLYRTIATDVSFGEECIVKNSRLPHTNIRIGPEHPSAEIALFLDPSCVHCKREFERYYSAVTGPRRDLSLSIFHLPLDGKCLPKDSNYQLKERRGAVENGACQASTAVECAESLAPGQGIKLLRELFMLQEKPGRWFSTRRISEAAQRIGLDGPAITACIDAQTERALLHQHSKFAFDHNLSPPTTLFVFFDEKSHRPLPTVVLDQGRKERSIEATLMEAERVSRKQNKKAPLPPK
ncbi:MAG TPA: vitamin K epoxide reductase family protein [Nannocystis exedens]|nr:vitamin K epoxide reductase family protein [Nannocystis exedens]